MTKKLLANDDWRPTIEEMRRTGHRVTQEEHDRFRRALSKPGHLLPSRMGRPPKGEQKYKSVNMRIAPDVLARLRLKAAKQGIGYQTLINQLLARAA
jgi:uncharacterized protein (DUF4415 family)